MREKIMAMFVAVTAAFLFCACGDGTKSVQGKDGASRNKDLAFTPSLDTEAEITLYAIGNWGNFEALEEVAKDFNEYYPNVVINYMMPDNYSKVLQNRLITGEELDFYLIQNYKGYDLAPYTKLAVDLEEAGIDFSNMPEAVKKGGYIDGEMKAFPLMQSVAGYMVNTSLLAEYGVKLPTNYGEFIAVCDALKEKGVTPIMGHPDSIYYPSVNSMFMEIKNAENSAEIIAALNKGEDRYGIIKKNLEKACVLKDKGYISDEGESFEDGYHTVIMRFLEGDVPFMACTAEDFSGVRKREAQSEAYTAHPFEYQFISSPTGEAGFETFYSEQIAFCAYAKSPNVDYTIEFFKFLATREELNVMGCVKGMPAVTENSGDARFAILEGLSGEEKVYLSDMDIDSRVVLAYREGCRELGNGRLDVDGTVEAIEEWMQGPMTVPQ